MPHKGATRVSPAGFIVPGTSCCLAPKCSPRLHMLLIHSPIQSTINSLSNKYLVHTFFSLLLPVIERSRVYPAPFCGLWRSSQTHPAGRGRDPSTMACLPHDTRRNACTRTVPLPCFENEKKRGWKKRRRRKKKRTSMSRQFSIFVLSEQTNKNFDI